MEVMSLASAARPAADADTARPNPTSRPSLSKRHGNIEQLDGGRKLMASRRPVLTSRSDKVGSGDVHGTLHGFGTMDDLRLPLESAATPWKTPSESMTGGAERSPFTRRSDATQTMYVDAA